MRNNNVEATARWCKSNGYCPVPIPRGEKGLKIPNWPEYRIAMEDIPNVFTDKVNIGVILGKPSNSLTDIDLDSLEARRAAPMILPKTFMIFGRKTSRRSHYGYEAEGSKTEKFIDPEDGEMIVEIRSDGCQTVLPGSLHPSGEFVEWETTALLQAAKVDYSLLYKAVTTLAAVALIAKRWKDGSRQEMALMVSGALAHGGLTAEEAERFIEAVCIAANDDETYKRTDACRDTFEKYRNGEPITGIPTLKEHLGEKVFSKLNAWLKLKKSTEAHGKEYRLTDVGNAHRLIDREKGNILWVELFGAFYFFNGMYYERDETREVPKKAMKTVEALFQEGIDSEDHARREQLLKHAMLCEGRRRISDMVDLAKAMPEVAVKPDIFDTKKMTLNCQNGELDLKTMELRPHSRESYFTKIISHHYDPSAQCPLWEVFLNRVTNGNMDLISFLQRAAGYTLTGDTGEQKFFFLYGTGRNGKGTFLWALQQILGPYARTALTTLFISQWGDKSKDDSSLEKAGLKGVRMVITDEIPEGRLHENVIKQLTGEDRIKGRFHRQDFFEYDPEFKVWMSGNNRPSIKNVDEAIRRRYILVPFDVTIPEEEKDVHLKDKLSKELPGILAWAVRGCRQWQQGGLDTPTVVKARTDEHLYDEDVFGRFFSDCCSKATRRDFVTNKEIQEAYREWSAAEGEKEMNIKAIAEKLKGRSCIKDKLKGDRIWRCLTLSNNITSVKDRCFSKDMSPQYSTIEEYKGVILERCVPEKSSVLPTSTECDDEKDYLEF